MLSAALPDPVFINRPDALKRLADTLSKEPIIAVDTESNSLHAYREQVCLIQFSSPQTDYLVDPLALNDLSPLGPLFANPKIEKVFHAADYDLICLRRDFSFDFANLFDTMMAASDLGRSEIGLGAILEKEFDVQMDKRYQRADWGERPLPRELLAYARMDTHFLIPLRNRLRAELIETGRWPLAVEDFSHIMKVTAQVVRNGVKADDEFVPSSCWRITGSYDLDPQQAAVLLELCRYRDQVARSLNRPLFKVINDATLLAIAAALPANMSDLKQLPGMTQGQVRRHGHQILAAVRRGLDATPVHPPRATRPDDQYLNRLEDLRQWRKNKAQEIGVKSDVVLSRDLLMAVAERYPQTMDELTEILSVVPWRLEHFGPDILKVLNSK